MSTPHELIQQAIIEIENPRRRARVQAAYDANPGGAIERLVRKMRKQGDNGAADFMEGKVAIDPEKLSKWLELLIKLLPLILKFL